MNPIYAQVIVDVPTQQTNQPYTYAIPTNLFDLVQVGMRVKVPFGKRDVMGFVVNLIDQKPSDRIQIKAIQSVMDLVPVLNSELLTLSAHLAQDVFAFRISVLKMILPNALSATYQYLIQLQPTFILNDESQFLQELDQQVVQLSDFTSRQRRLISTLNQQGQLTVEMLIQDRLGIKTQRAYQITADDDLLVQAQLNLRANAHQQSQLLAFARQNLGQAFTQKELVEMTDLSSGTLRAGVSKGWLQVLAVEKLRRPQETMNQAHEANLALNEQQQQAFEKIITAHQNHTYQPFLLEGITGSGKTEVYLQAAQQIVQDGRTVLFLVPEIALTPQMIRRVSSRFGSGVAVLHSGLSEGERYDEWRRIQRGDVNVVVGARSAVFAPLTNIGLIIVDEEHEVSYQQQDNPRYNARQVALWRGEYHHAPVILGSATPSLESRARAQKGLYQLLTLTKRAGDAHLPTVQVVDMRESLADNQETNFSLELKQKIIERIQTHQQVVLLLNRRGFSSFVMCRDCGYVPRDPNCNLAMTLHLDSHCLKCHYCGYQTTIPHRCPQCQSNRIRYYGTGTEKVARELEQILPEARVIRLDQDTTRKKGSLAKALQDFGQQKADILLGTQMVAKGLDFPNVTLVGVLNADTALGLPDFHASERTFQLLTQVSGRAGRGQTAGEVVVQTFNPEHYAIAFAQKHDYEGFYRYEMRLRQVGQYPPYYYTIQIQTSDLDENVVAVHTAQITRWLKTQLKKDVIILGPSPQPIAKLKKRYYFQILLKFKKPHENDALLQELIQLAQQIKGNFQVNIVRNPLTFM
ncbi:primosomal protein N' [Convivina praedatoris]|uniref:Replication restart protein PriA n=1 Tax=Convivina praedatoris TaxID=2880963 RepID=A0ABM9D4J9_9LACO|nr:primosomal protein N' [Convivina sp. LMG 32447]CAH1855597.1 primosomal protein N' [Convivina sp. LMG 32447]